MPLDFPYEEWRRQAAYGSKGPQTLQPVGPKEWQSQGQDAAGSVDLPGTPPQVQAHAPDRRCSGCPNRHSAADTLPQQDRSSCLGEINREPPSYVCLFELLLRGATTAPNKGRIDADAAVGTGKWPGATQIRGH